VSFVEILTSRVENVCKRTKITRIESKYGVLGSDVSLEGCLSAANPKGLGAARLSTEATMPKRRDVDD